MAKPHAAIPTLPQNALSPDGYIVNQQALDCVPNGRYCSDYNGCGWICAFNTLKALGCEKPVADIVPAFRRGLIFGGMLGTNPFFVRRYLKKAGFLVKSTFTKRAMARKLAEADAAVLFYFHRHGAHFISAAPQADKLRVFNLTQVPTDIRSISELLSVFRFGILFTFTHNG